jgi:putative spermidine/putrescine transport system ATP-binding protein
MDASRPAALDELVVSPNQSSSDAVTPANERRPAVRLHQATKLYGELAAVDHVTLDIADRELFTLLGPSGSGKTTVIRMIAGLIRPTSGQIWIDEEEVAERAPYERHIALVFQSLALFPHMSVFSNVAFPLRMRRVGRKEIEQRVINALDVVRLPDVGRRRINELSGGQQQRVALARALVYEPKLLLLDEPLGALDRRLREEMQLEIVRLHQTIDVTIVNVTHDQREALMISDRIGVMRAGRLEQVGTSHEMYPRPRTRFVAEFLGDANLLDGTAATDGATAWVELAGGKNVTISELDSACIGRPVSVVVRAETIRIDGAATAIGTPNEFPGTVILRAFEGAAMYYEVDVPGLSSRLKVTAQAAVRHQVFEQGDAVRVGWEPADTPTLPLEEP